MSTEMDKLNNASETHKDVLDFLAWIGEHPDLCLGEWLRVRSDGSQRTEPLLIPVSRSVESVVFEYLGIDGTALEQERRALLDSLRQLGAGRLST